jgi:hypothetical protein
MVTSSVFLLYFAMKNKWMLCPVETVLALGNILRGLDLICYSNKSAWHQLTDMLKKAIVSPSKKLSNSPTGQGWMD